jgi:histidyl-tRNA synthetase
VWFPADDGRPDHEVRDLRNREQAVADPASWMPPEEDLRPHVVLG